MKEIINKNFSNLNFKKNVLPCKVYKISKFNFSNIYNNFPITPHYFINGRFNSTDLNSFYYEPMIRAFIDKRWILKQDIPPKIKILPGISGLKDILSTQKISEEKYIVNLDENILKYIYEEGNLSRNYIFNLIFEKNEFELNKEILEKVIINGYAVKYFDEDYKNYSSLLEKIKELVKNFYVGQSMTELEKIIETIYAVKKYNRMANIELPEGELYIGTITDKDIVATKGLISIPDKVLKKDDFNINLILENLNVERYLNTIIEMSKMGKSRFNKIFMKIFSNEYHFKNNHKINILASAILNRLFIYLQSREFEKIFQSDLNFYTSNGILSIHLWLICQRLQNFKRSKIAYDLLHEILKLDKSHASEQFDKVDAVRKISKFRNINEVYETQKNTFHYHFNIYEASVNNNYFKIDSLVWSQIFRQKIPRYDDRVYKMSEYIIYHFEKFKSLTLDDYLNLNIKFEINSSIPFNFKDRVQKYNPALSEEEFFKEKFSNFIYKKYFYEYKTSEERDISMLKKTYAREFHFNNYNSKNEKMKSKRLIDGLYDELVDVDKKQEEAKNIDEELSKLNKNNSIMYLVFSSWCTKNYSQCIESCEKEDEIRRKNIYNVDYLKYLGNSKIKRFSENLDNNVREILYNYRQTVYNTEKHEDELSKINEKKMFNPDANIISSRRKKKPFADRVFRLKKSL